MLNHVDYLLSKWSVIGPFRMKYVVELGGIIFIASAAILKLRGNMTGSGERWGARRLKPSKLEGLEAGR